MALCISSFINYSWTYMLQVKKIFKSFLYIFTDGTAPELKSENERTKISYGCDAVVHDSQNHST
jgi:hypothetical protein